MYQYLKRFVVFSECHVHCTRIAAADSGLVQLNLVCMHSIAPHADAFLIGLYWCLLQKSSEQGRQLEVNL